MVFRSADELNAGLATDFGYVNPPPFKETVTEFITVEAEQFVRFHGDNQVSAFVMKASDVQNLSLEEIIDLYSIPNGELITNVSFVNIPTGTKLHGGLANEGLGFNGGGYQFYIDRTQFEDTFVPQGWFENPPISVNDFLNY